MNYIVAILVVALTIACIRINELSAKKQPAVENPKLNEEYWQYLDVIEMQLQQLELDHITHFISDDLYESRKKDISKRLTQLKKDYEKATKGSKLVLA